MDSIEQGYFEVHNPYNRSIARVPAAAAQVHSIVFWSKDFGPFIADDYGRRLRRLGYHLFFNFTINSPHTVLEPRLPPLAQRLTQLARLCDRFGPESVQWRFDPICFFQNPSGGMENNLDQFSGIAAQAASLGIRRCITSFVDRYRKVIRRVKAFSDLEMVELPMERKIAVIDRLAGCLAGIRMALRLCCEKEVLAALPPDHAVRGAACIPARHLARLYGDDVSLSLDRGQRRAAGCGCGVSRDIGSYHLHPCRHNCLYCYANPAADRSGRG